MTTPTQATPSSGRPGNRTLAAATAAVIGALALYATLHRAPVVNVELCTIGDTANPQTVADVLRSSGAPSDTLLPLDSTLIAAMDSASQARIAGLHILVACEDLDRDTTAAHLTIIASQDSLVSQTATAPP